MTTRTQTQRISLVTCSYQQGRYIESTLRSVLSQHYPNLEYIVMDGGSTDETMTVLARYRSRCSKVVTEADDGQTDALVKGFHFATGEIMGWLCSDDLLLPGALQAVDRYFREHPGVQAAYGDALWIDDQGKLLRPKKEIDFNRFVFLYDHNYIPQPSMFWRRSLYEWVGGLDRRFDLAMDGDLWERFSRVTRIAHIPRYLSCMRFYPQQKTRSRRSEARGEDARIWERGRLGARAGWSYPACHAAAKLMRVLAKTKAGAYGASVPTGFHSWLDEFRPYEFMP